MKKQQDYLNDISEIRQMMEKTSRFLSLSGVSGVVIGLIALAGAFLAWSLTGFAPTAFRGGAFLPASGSGLAYYLFLDAVAVLALAILAGLFFSWRKARKRNLAMWTPAGRNMLVQMAIPLATGGILCLILWFREDYSLLASLMLLFYGLSLVQASRYTYREIRSLGMAETGLGILAAVFPVYGLFLWAAGFGLLHIAYGIYMYLKHER